jgi:signal transduction histidine kinase
MRNGRKPQSETLRAITDSQVAGLRLLLGTTALAVRSFGAAEDGPSFDLSYGLLLAYNLYCVVGFRWARRYPVLSAQAHVFQVCVDLGFYTALSVFGTGMDLLAFPFLLFVVITAYSQLGVRAGVVVTVLGISAFLSLAYFGETSESSSRLILRSAALVAVGTALAYWARANQILRQKLDLLRDVSIASNPRFGMDRMTSHVMKRVLEFFHADTCVLIGYVGDSNDYVLRVARREAKRPEGEAITSPEDLRDLLQKVFGSRLGLYTQQKRWRRSTLSVSWDPRTVGVPTKMPANVANSIAEWLQSRSFVAVPLRHHEWLRGYLLMGSANPAAFGKDDARFLLQLADQVTPVLEHIRVMDRMASDAAEEEYRRIGRSIHDRVIQPYIGLQIGLHGFRRILKSALPDDDNTISPRMSEAMTSVDYVVSRAKEGLEDLRDYVHGLRELKRSSDPLLDSLRRYTDKFTAVTGIQVTINQIHKGSVTDRLAAEILQMATEALRDVQRHTTSTAVELTIEPTPDGAVAVRTTDNSPQKEAIRKYAPEPAAFTNLAAGINIHTVVNVKIPL